jgi:histone H3/H4
MSSTRRASKDAPLAQERYMSSPEFAERRAINGHAVTEKASILSSARKRRLLYYVQAKSIDPGLPEFGRLIVDKFPERLGSQTLRSLGGKQKKYTVEQRRAIGAELGWRFFHSESHATAQLSALDQLDGERPRPFAAEPNDVPECPSALAELCRQDVIDRLPAFLLELCINPRIELHEPGEPENFDSVRDTSDRDKVLRTHPSLNGYEFRPATIRHFEDIVGALFEFEEAERTDNVADLEETEVSRQIVAELEAALRHPDRVYAVEGCEGIGKTHTAKLWCKRNAGRARYVSLSGAANKTAIFRAISSALGLAASYTRKANEMQAHVEGMLQRCKLLLVIDEARYLLPQSERIYSRPEMLDWVYSALANCGVPSFLICTSLFASRVKRAEQQLDWNARQFQRRCKYKELAAKLEESDLARVAAKLMPECGKREVEYVTSYGLISRWSLTFIVAAIEDARDIATRDDRKTINHSDLRRAIRESRIPSDDAQARAFGTVKKGRRTTDAAELQADFSGPERGRTLPAESTADATEGQRISAELLGA